MWTSYDEDLSHTDDNNKDTGMIHKAYRELVEKHLLTLRPQPPVLLHL